MILEILKEFEKTILSKNNQSYVTLIEPDLEIFIK